MPGEVPKHSSLLVIIFAFISNCSRCHITCLTRRGKSRHCCRCIYAICQHPEVEARVAAELAAAGLLATHGAAAAALHGAH